MIFPNQGGAQVWGEILLGIAGIITAVGGLWQARSRTISAELATCQAAQQRIRVTAMRHIATLERALWSAGFSWVPDRPEELL